MQLDPYRIYRPKDSYIPYSFFSPTSDSPTHSGGLGELGNFSSRKGALSRSAGDLHHRRRPLWAVHFKRKSHQTETGVTNATPPLSIVLLTKTRLCAFGPKRKGSAPSEREIEWDREKLGLDARVTTAGGAPHNMSPTTARVAAVLHTLDDMHIPTSHIGRPTAMLPSS